MFIFIVVTYLGCYRVTSDLPYQQGQDTVGNSPISCAQNCLTENPSYKYIGVRGTSYCHCGETVGNTKVGEHLCQSPCPGDSNAPCGDGTFVVAGAVYAVDAATFKVPTKMADKSGWVATGSPGTKNLNQLDAVDPAGAIDGDTDTYFKSSSGSPYSWIQVLWIFPKSCLQLTD